MMSNRYKDGYNKGYYAGKRSADVALKKANARALAAAARAENAEKANGLGPCSDCQYWRRGDAPAAGWERCYWGVCDLKEITTSTCGAFWSATGLGGNEVKIITAKDFGCVGFLRIEGTR